MYASGYNSTNCTSFRAAPPKASAMDCSRYRGRVCYQKMSCGFLRVMPETAWLSILRRRQFEIRYTVGVYTRVYLFFLTPSDCPISGQLFYAYLVRVHPNLWLHGLFRASHSHTVTTFQICSQERQQGGKKYDQEDFGNGSCGCYGGVTVRLHKQLHGNTDHSSGNRNSSRSGRSR